MNSRWQITFIILNRFCILSKITSPPPPPPHLTDSSNWNWNQDCNRQVISIRDRWQIPLVMLNRFCILSKPLHPPFKKQFQTERNDKENLYLFYIIFNIPNVLLIKSCKLQLPVLLFLVLHKLLYQQIFIFKTFYNLIVWEKVFVTNLSFLPDLSKPPPLLRLQFTKRDESFFVDAPLLITNCMH